MEAKLTRLLPHLIHDELRACSRDICNHVFRVNASTSAMREMLGVATSVNLAGVIFEQNEVVKKLAGWATMLVAPTLLTRCYG